MSKSIFQTITLLALAFWGCHTAKKTNKMEPIFTQITVFGDGLSDMGQWGKLTNYQYPPADLGFHESRWTNGKTWVEHFAEGLGLPISLKNNYAMGGATTGAYNINEPLRQALKLGDDVKLNGMLAQVQAYLASKPKISDKDLFVLWAGGHDIGNYLEYGQPDLKQSPPSANYAAAIDLLAKTGAKNIFVGTMPDMGFSPGYFGTPKQAQASQLCLDLNAGLQKIAQQYQGTAVRFLLFDGAGVFAKVGMNPAAYGIQYTEAYLPMNVIDFMNPLAKSTVAVPNKEKGLNPDEFMNWWAVSASARVHRIIGEEALVFVKSVK